MTSPQDIILEVWRVSVCLSAWLVMSFLRHLYLRIPHWLEWNLDLLLFYLSAHSTVVKHLTNPQDIVSEVWKLSACVLMHDFPCHFYDIWVCELFIKGELRAATLLLERAFNWEVFNQSTSFIFSYLSLFLILCMGEHLV